MTVATRGLSIQSAYRQYREGHLIVNRKYQRKLVWAVEEKSALVDSILRGYPIPLIFLAEHRDSEQFEIVDGLQRLNAIFDFIENKFDFEGLYFDVSQLPRAQQAADEEIFVQQTLSLLTANKCADFLDYELATTYYPATDDEEITEIFGRINSRGRQLSNQERRQAGVINPFAELVRTLAAELRGDVSSNVLLLSQMPRISIDTNHSNQGYGIKAEDTDWCRQGILNVRLLRESEDEQLLADIMTSVLLGEPFNASRERLDELYNDESELYKKVLAKLALTQVEDLSHNIKTTFTVLIQIIENYDTERNALRRIVRESRNARNPMKTEFYAIFMALYRLVVLEEQSPVNNDGIITGFTNLQSRLTSGGHYITTPDRRKNIDVTYGLISPYFSEKEPPVIRHGSGLKIDFVNSIRRSRTETPRYEFKQGIVDLYEDRGINEKVIAKIIETFCAIANSGPHADGYLFIGLTDTKEDKERVELLDEIRAIEIEGRFIVGIDRECKVLGVSIDAYVEILLNRIRNSDLSDPLKTQILSQIDPIPYEEFTVIRFVVPKQTKLSSIGGDIFMRDGTATIKATSTQAVALSEMFR